MQRIALTPEVLTQVVELRMATGYCAQRADLIGYHRMLIVWRNAMPDPLVKNGIGRSLGVLNAIEAHTKAVLGIIIPALDA